MDTNAIHVQIQSDRNVLNTAKALGRFQGFALAILVLYAVGKIEKNRQANSNKES